MGQEIIQEVLKTNSALRPITVTEFGQFGTLFKQFIYRKDTIPLPVFLDKDQTHVEVAARLARSNKAPCIILPHANQIWRTEHANEFCGFSYKAVDPTTYAEQKSGLVTTTAISNQIIGTHR